MIMRGLCHALRTAPCCSSSTVLSEHLACARGTRLLGDPPRTAPVRTLNPSLNPIRICLHCTRCSHTKCGPHAPIRSTSALTCAQGMRCQPSLHAQRLSNSLAPRARAHGAGPHLTPRPSLCQRGGDKGAPGLHSHLHCCHRSTPGLHTEPQRLRSCMHGRGEPGPPRRLTCGPK